MKDECLYSWRTLVCTVNTGLLQLRAEKDSTANIRPNATRPTMRVIRALISTIFLLFDASGCVYSLISRLESEGSISGNHFGITWAELCMTGRIKKKKTFCRWLKHRSNHETGGDCSDGGYLTCSRRTAGLRVSIKERFGENFLSVIHYEGDDVCDEGIKMSNEMRKRAGGQIDRYFIYPVGNSTRNGQVAAMNINAWAGWEVKHVQVKNRASHHGEEQNTTTEPQGDLMHTHR